VHVYLREACRQSVGSAGSLSLSDVMQLAIALVYVGVALQSRRFIYGRGRPLPAIWRPIRSGADRQGRYKASVRLNVMAVSTWPIEVNRDRP
jgi:hypothetical protein